MDPSLQSIKPNNWWAASFKKKKKLVHLIELYTWACDTVRWQLVRGYPFCQLSIDYNMDVLKDVHY